MSAGSKRVRVSRKKDSSPIAAMIAEGKTYAEIGHVLGISISSVYLICKAEGLRSVRGKGVSRGKYRVPIAEMRVEGNTYAQIGRVLGISGQRVYWICKAEGLSVRTRQA